MFLTGANLVKHLKNCIQIYLFGVFILASPCFLTYKYQILMKKLILCGAIALVSFSASAQKKSDVKFGVRAGLVSSNMVQSQQDNEMAGHHGYNTSFYLGGVVNVPVTSMLSLQPGLTYTSKGHSTNHQRTFGGTKYTLNYATRIHYLEIPVNLVAKLDAGSGKVLIGAGPYLSYALGGNMKNSSLKNGKTESEEFDLRFGSNNEENFRDDKKENHLNSRFDYGLNFSLGYQFSNRLSLNATYSLGLANLHAGEYKYETGNDKLVRLNNSLNNRALSLGLGFTF